MNSTLVTTTTTMRTAVIHLALAVGCGTSLVKGPSHFSFPFLLHLAFILNSSIAGGSDPYTSSTSALEPSSTR